MPHSILQKDPYKKSGKPIAEVQFSANINTTVYENQMTKAFSKIDTCTTIFQESPPIGILDSHYEISFFVNTKLSQVGHSVLHPSGLTKQTR